MKSIPADDGVSGRPHLACLACGNATVRPIYEVFDVPVYNSLLADSATEAHSNPTGDIRLMYCGSCGFIMNELFDASLQAYSPKFEDSQHFSNCFSSFAKSLAQRWIDQFDIRGKSILEIGCGKADFLELFCDLGDNRGIGIDPACVPERLSAAAQKHITLIQDYYSDEYSNIETDVICCRHTLEHILPTGDFVRLIRRNIGPRHDTLVIFELPDVTRILRERAFWDIYYEHCSYFTAGSLARLFRRSGFDILDLRRDYDDQYLTLVARPSSGPTKPVLQLENDLEETTDDVNSFLDECPQKVSGWQETLRRLCDDGKEIAAWGSGSKFVAFCTTLGITTEVSFVVDINPYKHGKFSPSTGHRIVAPEHLRENPPDIVLVMNPIYCEEIQADLDRLGVEAELIPV